MSHFELIIKYVSNWQLIMFNKTSDYVISGNLHGYLTSGHFIEFWINLCHLITCKNIGENNSSWFNLQNKNVNRELAIEVQYQKNRWNMFRLQHIIYKMDSECFLKKKCFIWSFMTQYIDSPRYIPKACAFIYIRLFVIHCNFIYVRLSN